MDGGQLVDERQRHAEGMQRGPGRIREVGGVGEWVDVVQILDAAREGHRLAVLLADGLFWWPRSSSQRKCRWRRRVT